MNKYERAKYLRLLRLGRPVWEVTGIWSGYRASQERECHRHYTSDPKQAEVFKEHYGIRFTDGTMLRLNVRQIKDKKELSNKTGGYDSLISQCLKHDIWDVGNLP